MANFAQYLTEQHARGREDAVAIVAGIWVEMSDGKARSVSGIRKWFDDHADQIPGTSEQHTAGLQQAVAEYTSQRDGNRPPQVSIPQELAERLAGMDQRLEGIEQALVWIVDAISGQAAAQMDSRSTQDYRDWAGGDATRSEAAAMGLVTPRPDAHLRGGQAGVPDGTQPGYEHVLPPGVVPHSEDPARVEAMQQGEYQPSQDPGNFYYGADVRPDPGLVASPEGPVSARADLADAVAAEAARIQASTGDDEVAYYDESAAVQQAPAAGYSPEQWRAWALTSDIPDESGQQ